MGVVTAALKEKKRMSVSGQGRTSRLFEADFYVCRQGRSAASSGRCRTEMLKLLA